MKQLIFVTTLFIMVLCISCNSNHASASNNKENTTADNTILSSSTATSAETNSSANKDNDEISASPLLDSGKLQSDLNDMMSAVTSGNPDTTKLKSEGADILSTDAAMLSDSGIDKLYGNSNDPSLVAAKNSLKKMRDGMGITPDKLDSIKKSCG